VTIPQPGVGLRRTFGVVGATLVLVRPDGYLAAVETPGSVGAIQRFLDLAGPASG
jgi:hypothetical protein